MSTIQTKLERAQRELEGATDEGRIEELQALIEYYQSQLTPSTHGAVADERRRFKDQIERIRGQLKRGEEPEELEELEEEE